ncbi:MAG: hypothetical protein U5R49_24760 [Deltaproteobacteria bacterium]|nr:hypothetical protein [Deltaproteobacteria bacterium]
MPDITTNGMTARAIRDGLKGDDIPLSARIVAVADVYDALVNKRVYKEAYPHEKAKGIIIQSRGKHLDRHL